MGSTSNKNQNGICIKSNTAHLISLGNSRLSTEVTLFEIPLGNLTIGAGDSCDIVLKGAGILDVHCRCSRKEVADGESDENLGDVTITPFENAKVYVEGSLLISNDEYVLQQGDVIRLGESVLLRFNFPAKAAILKSNAMEHNKKTISDNYEVLKKNLNTNCVNFTEFSNSSDKTLNNNVKITDKMKNLKMKGNDSYPKISNLQVFPVTSKSIENCSNLSNGTANNIDEMQQLEDVLKMFVEYNNSNNNGCSSSDAVNQSSRNNILQTSSEKINITHQNRIKTNGSLPKNFHTKDHAQNHFEFYDNDSRATDDIEIYKKPQSPRTRIKTFVSSPTSNSSTKSLSPTDNNDKSYEYDKNSSSNEKDYEKLIRSFEEKFRMDIYNIQHCENLNHIDVRGDIADNNLHSSNLNGEKNEILAKIRELKILISDIQFQESETFLESDVEKSLVLAEMSNEKTNLALLNEKLQVIKAKMKQLEVTRLKRQKQQEIQQIKLKNIIKDKEAEIKMLEEQKEVSIHTESRLDELQESLESDIKTYEDLEFHYLEEETDWASLMEEYKENINMFTKQIEDKKNYIHQLEQTSLDNESSTQNDQKTLETKLFNLKQKLENEREKLKNIDKILSMKISSATESNDTQISNNNTNSAFDDDKSFNNSIVATNTTSSDIMSKSFNENMFFNRSKIEVSFFDFNMTTESLPRNSKFSTNSSPERKQVVSATPKRVTESDNNNSPLMMPKYHSLSSINYVNDNNNSQKKVIVPIMNGNVKNDDYRQRPSTSSSSSTSRNAVQLRTLPKQKRPLTQFLPNFRLDFNLRNHIETAGHQIQLCPHVIIDATSCRGYLNKVGSKPLFSNLRANTRWFVFDRQKQMFVYYSDKGEKKPRGGAYFNAISDVYFDHSIALKRTFIVKTKTRTFTLQAPSTQACSIWIDVIITGAQGKIFEYEK
ncbi:pleckstrin homology-like domain family B member 3 [Chironomus tepperi]|uniref:pleckstrin homology-like domain family B member 3 n=1 Tax=Chironomus tepperi TaxID=113505 RepID=UPI00391F3FF2